MNDFASHADHPQLGSIDRFFLYITLSLMAIGLVFVLSASWHQSMTFFHNPWALVLRHSASVILAMPLMFILSFTHYRWWKHYAWIMVILIIISLILTAKFGVVTGGARRWFSLGFFKFQASEFAKLAAAIIATKVLIEKKNRIIALLAVAVMGYLVLEQPDLGTTMVIMSAVVLALYAYGFNLFVLIAGLAGAGFVVWQHILKTPYQLLRIKYWLDPFSDPLGYGYNLIQSIKAIGSGGLWGVGFGGSVQKLGPLPVAYADFIFSVICEELGFLGAMTVLILLAAWIWRALYICFNIEDNFAKILGFTLVIQLALQIFINIGVATGLFPITGMTLPFISFGGSSFLTSAIVAGIILNISRFSKIAG